MGLARGILRTISPSTLGLVLALSIAGCSSERPAPEPAAIPDELLIAPVDLADPDLRRLMDDGGKLLQLLFGGLITQKNIPGLINRIGDLFF